MVKIEVSDAGIPSSPISRNPFANRRVQRILAAAAITFLFATVLLSRPSWTQDESIYPKPDQVLNQSPNTHAPGPAAASAQTPPAKAANSLSPPPLDIFPAPIPEPNVQLQTHVTTIPNPTLDPTRVALIIETRAIPHLPALILTFITNLPPQWIVKHVGGTAAFDLIKSNIPLRRHIASGKLLLVTLPDEFPTKNNEDLSATLTDLKFYRDFLAPAEWLLMFQTDSIICSGSPLDLDDWAKMGYDWVGAPWHPNVKGGNGGLSLRYVPSIVKLLSTETRKAKDDAWEDLWLCQRLPNAAPADVEMNFSVEMFYNEKPLGYHLRGSGKLVDAGIWGNRTRRRQIMNYCPEVKLILGITSLQSAHEDRWRLEDEGKAPIDYKKNYEAAVAAMQGFHKDNAIEMAKVDGKEQYTIAPKIAPAAKPASDPDNKSPALGGPYGTASPSSAKASTSTATPTVNVDQNSYGENQETPQAPKGAEAEKAALAEALQQDKSKWS